MASQFPTEDEALHHPHLDPESIPESSFNANKEISEASRLSLFIANQNI